MTSSSRRTLSVELPMRYGTMSAQELAQCLQSTDADRTRVLVVDVRGDDLPGGRIPGSLALDFKRFNADEQNSVTEVAQAAQELAQQAGGDVPVVVLFTCMYSKERGPFCAQRMISFYEAQEQGGDAPEVLLLEGGMQRWVDYLLTSVCKCPDVQAMASGEHAETLAPLLEAFDPDAWVPYDNPLGLSVVYKADLAGML